MWIEMHSRMVCSRGGEKLVEALGFAVQKDTGESSRDATAGL